MAPAHDYEVIVIGSGFGGAVTACRLAEAGRQVLVLERGRRWRQDQYPRAVFTDDLWTYDSRCPEERNGWLELHLWRHMSVVTAAGVGGGSLVYANVSEVPPKDTFDCGWPAEIKYDKLQPHYKTVGEMLNVQTIPDTQLTRRFELTREAAEKIGDGDRFVKLNVAVRFNKDWNYDLPDPFSTKHSKFEDNGFGHVQGTCIHCGMCDIGCPVHAKNTLDLNYLARAETKGAEIRPLHLIRSVEPFEGGYRLNFDRIDVDERRLVRGSVTGRRVVLAAGSLGSTELLLRCRDQYRTLPNLSPFLGQHWSSNGDFMTPAFYNDTGRLVSPTHGPTITCGIFYLDGVKSNQERYHIEDGGFPPLIRTYLEKRLGPKGLKANGWRTKLLLAGLSRRLGSNDETRHVMPWFANGVDAANGTMSLGRSWLPPWRKELKLRWEIRRSKDLIDKIVNRHKQLSEATGGEAWVPPTWRFFHSLITPHPLGGCNMGTTSADGVVDHRGKVFNYEGLYVFDGAVLPEAIGINPSRTIAAVTERNVGLLLEEMGAA
jgi:cholesterol oxidase